MNVIGWNKHKYSKKSRTEEPIYQPKEYPIRLDMTFGLSHLEKDVILTICLEKW